MSQARVPRGGLKGNENNSVCERVGVEEGPLIDAPDALERPDVEGVLGDFVWTSIAAQARLKPRS